MLKLRQTMKKLMCRAWKHSRNTKTHIRGMYNITWRRNNENKERRTIEQRHPDTEVSNNQYWTTVCTNWKKEKK